MDAPDRARSSKTYFIPNRTVTGLSGDGGTGKSLLAMQLACGVAYTGEWLALPIENQRPVVFFSAEDELDEMHRRLVDICNAESVDLAELEDLHILPLAGLDAILATFDRRNGSILKTPLWEELIGVRQAVVPHMAAGGRIITTGSVTADRVGFPGASVYAMTKGALAALTRGLARDLGPRGITVNVVQPGPTETDMNAGEETRAMVRPLMALGRMGRDAEVASFVAYLAGSEASFVTGSALTIDGGYLARGISRAEGGSGSSPAILSRRKDRAACDA